MGGILIIVSYNIHYMNTSYYLFNIFNIYFLKNILNYQK